MQNLLNNYEQQIFKKEFSPEVEADIVEIRNAFENDQTLILEIGAGSITIPFPNSNNDSIQSFPKAFSVCLQSIDLDCNTGVSVTSDITIETTEKYEININGVSTVMYGDALLSYLESLPDVVVEQKL